jgi:hypothetical protein
MSIPLLLDFFQSSIPGRASSGERCRTGYGCPKASDGVQKDVRARCATGRCASLQIIVFVFSVLSDYILSIKASIKYIAREKLDVAGS